MLPLQEVRSHQNFCPERQKVVNKLDKQSRFGKRYDGPCTFGETTLMGNGYESLEVLIVSSMIDDCVWIMDSDVHFI